MSDDNLIDDIETAISRWRPRDVLRRTNWLYRIDALRPRDVREMQLLLDLVNLYQDYAEMFMAWGHALKFISERSSHIQSHARIREIISTIVEISKYLLSEVYCFYLDYLQIAYYPSSNRITRSLDGERFPLLRRTVIRGLGENESRDMTGLSVSQLILLHQHLRVPAFIRDEQSRRVFNGEESFLHYLTYNRLGLTKLQLSLYHFGGDPRRFTYSIRAMTNHLYHTFYHKVSGDSMRQWLPHIDSFRRAIWQKIMSGGTVETSYADNVVNQTLIQFSIPFESFRIFGFLDDTGYRTSAPGNEARRRMGFHDDLQRSFYSGYFAGHGLKLQAASLPNGMIGSIYLGSWRVSDSGLLNLSGLDTYLSDLFSENNIIIPGNEPSYPVLYGDGVFPTLPTVLPRYSNPSQDERRINTRLSNARQNIEHIFGLHRNIFKLFDRPERFQLLHQGNEAVRLIFNSFLLLNCYTCFNESRCSFFLRPPSIGEYLPIEEELPNAPNVTDQMLGEVYQFTRRR